jgi:hypothetical protein
MSAYRFATPRLKRSTECGHQRVSYAWLATTWTAFMAGLWSRRIALVLTLIALPACSELAQPAEEVPPGAQPPYVLLAANHLRSVLKDRASYDSFEISNLRWVQSLNGWSWLACVRFQDRGHRRSYALFMQANAVVDGRYAVQTDACDAQSYIQFDLATGELGRPTLPVQEPLY